MALVSVVFLHVDLVSQSRDREAQMFERGAHDRDELGFSQVSLANALAQKTARPRVEHTRLGGT
jgi:hypothetical protein